MTKQGGRGDTMYCAISITKSNWGVAIQEVLNAKNSIDQSTIPE